MSTPGLAIGKKGNIDVEEETGKTSRERIWAGGDVVTGAATVISAMEQDANLPNLCMQRFLGGNKELVTS